MDNFKRFEETENKVTRRNTSHNKSQKKARVAV